MFLIIEQYSFLVNYNSVFRIIFFFSIDIPKKEHYNKKEQRKRGDIKWY